MIIYPWFVEAVFDVHNGDAAQYVQRYHTIEVPKLDFKEGEFVKTGEMLKTPIREYLNARFKNRAGFSHRELMRLKNHLIIDWPRVMRRKGYFTVTRTNKKLSFTNKQGVFLEVNPEHVSAAFYGKGSPAWVKETVELLNLWRTYMIDVREKESGKLKLRAKGEEKGERYEKEYPLKDTLAEMVGGLLGVDCNGFTGHYLKSKYRQLDVKPGTTEKTYVKKGGGNSKKFLRKTIPEIEADDIAVFYDGGRFHHVAMVNHVLSKSAHRGVLSLAESRTHRKKNGGPQHNIWHITPKKRPVKKAGKINPLGQFEITGRNNETYVLFVSYKIFA